MKSFNEWSELKESFFSKEPSEVVAKNLSYLGDQLLRVSEQMPEISISNDPNISRQLSQSVSKQLKIYSDKFGNDGNIKEFLVNLSELINSMKDAISWHHGK